MAGAATIAEMAAKLMCNQVKFVVYYARAALLWKPVFAIRSEVHL